MHLALATTDSVNINYDINTVYDKSRLDLDIDFPIRALQEKKP